MMGRFGGMMGRYGYGTGFGGSFWPGLIGMIIQALFLVALVVIAIYFIRRFSKTSLHRSGSALNILDERYARGEITSEQYQQMKKELQV